MGLARSAALKKSIDSAHKIANDYRHLFVTPEHLLLGLLDDPEIEKVLISVNGKIEPLRARLREYLQGYSAIQSSSDGKITETLSVGRILQRSAVNVDLKTRKEIRPVDVLISLFEDVGATSVSYLAQQGISQQMVKEFHQHGIKPKSETVPANVVDPATDPNASFLVRFARNLNQLAREKKIDPLIGREDEVRAVAKIMRRRTKNNALLVGDAGVGKTAIVEGLAIMIENNDPDLPEVLRGKTLYDLDTGLLLAGTKYRGDYEERLKGVIAELTADPNAVVFIDEIHTLLGAGASSGGGPDASNMLKPALARGQIRVLGATTIDEYRRIFEKDAALSRRFKKVDVEEPNITDAIMTLTGVAKKQEEHHGVQISREAIIGAVKLTDRHIQNRRLPDKAIDLLDDTCASWAGLPPDQRPSTILLEHVEQELALSQNIPAEHLSANDRQKAKMLLSNLKSNIFGQDHALEPLAQAYKNNRAGFGASEPRPILQALLDGPPGTGKTETARTLAKFLGIELVRIDMSEYMEKHTVSKLIGAPPGYVGFDQGGVLTEAVNKKPHCVLLLDEVEKAHADVLNVLLQVMDHGALTDGNGRKVPFKNVIILMTTNLGANDQSTTMGFTNAAQNDQDEDESCPLAIKRHFPSEFIDRLDVILSYHKLEHANVRNIAEKFLLVSKADMIPKDVIITYDDATLDYLAKVGVSQDTGARPMKRKIKKLIEKPIANEVVDGALEHGGTATISVDPSGKSLTFAFTAANQNKPAVVASAQRKDDHLKLDIA